MEQKKAQLITRHYSGNIRILHEIEGSGHYYVTANQESRRSVVITQASTKVLKEELLLIGLVIENAATIEKVAKKFAKELASIPGGKLALDEEFGLGLCEIL